MMGMMGMMGMMDSSFQQRPLDEIGAAAAPAPGDAIGPFGDVARPGDLEIAGYDGAAAQQFGDLMDLDIDLDASLWAADLDHAHPCPEQDAEPAYCSSSSSISALPADFLFAEDEGVLPAVSPGGPAQQPDVTAGMQLDQAPEPEPMLPSPTFSVPPSDMEAPDAKHADDCANDHGLARERLRRQLSLLSKGWCGDEIRFKNCDPPKAVILHNLAIELGLGYKHDVRTREVSMCRLDPLQAASAPQPALGRQSSSLARSSTELDSTLCLPGLPVIPEHRLPEVTPATPFTPNTSPPSTQPRQPSSVAKEQQLSRHPSRSERISDSISKHVSTLKTSIAKGGRRGPLSENGRRDMRALEGRRRLLEMQGPSSQSEPQPVRSSSAVADTELIPPQVRPWQSVPVLPAERSHATPGEDAPLWPLIGCRRGPLADSVPAQLPCPASRQPQKLETGEPSTLARRRCSVDVAERCLLSAESQRLADMKAVLEGAADKLSIGDPSLRSCFFSFIEAGRYRDHESLHTSHTFDGKTVTYTELIAIIAWELAENQTLLPLLEIKSWESFMGMLQTACIYESEVGQTSLVILSMVCLRHSLEALRLYSANLLLPDAHEDCSGGQCQLECVRNLGSRVAAYVDELSSVIFNKENMRDRRWWLSTFYSLYIQSYVRHALITIEKQLHFRSADDVPAEDLTATQYLHLPAVLFAAASAKYDPLLGGRLQYALTDNTVIPETSVPELHHSSARVACEVDKWPDAGIRTPYQFLRRQLQIGSLDFSDSGLDASRKPVSGSPLTPGVSPLARRKVASPSSQSPTSGSEFVLSPRPYSYHSKRDSINSQFSAPPSTIFSNQSSDSLARTLSTDMTSVYEPSVLAGLSFSDSVTDLDGEMRLDIGMINPNSLFSANQSLLTQSFDQPMVKGTSKTRGDHGMCPSPAFICSCCPRAPRRFYTREELIQHEAEKPHPCTQCKKRFKSPTEAERHINAIHVKSDSWSCRALENALLAFQSETFNGVVWDVCGFCGGGFARKGDVADEAELVSHLESVHKIGECDRNKKFYRADNFRQHLKNTHVAKPGKWLKALESVCRTTREAA